MELWHGMVGGACGLTLCYPFSTFKTRKQTIQGYSALTDLRQNGIRSLYVGYPSPLIGMMLEKSVLFFGYDKIKNYWKTKQILGMDFTPFRGGLLAGFLTYCSIFIW